VIEAKTKGEHFVEQKEGYRYFTISVGDLVYMPSESHNINFDSQKTNTMSLYRMVSTSGKQCYFIPNSISSIIKENVEFGSPNKTERALDGRMIKEFCFPVGVDRIGRISPLGGWLHEDIE
jgi:CRISPR-associated endonuclease Csn1